MNPIVVLILLIIVTGSAVFFTKKRGMKQQEKLVEAIVEETAAELVDGGSVVDASADAPAALGKRSRSSVAGRIRRAARRALRRERS